MYIRHYDFFSQSVQAGKSLKMPLTSPIDIGQNTITMLFPREYRGSVQQSFIHHPSMLTDFLDKIPS
jgi:hypothetical protein